MIKNSRKEYYLAVDITTSNFQQHNSFDYQATVQEFSQTVSSHHKLSLEHQFIHIFRDRKSFDTTFKSSQNLQPIQGPENCEYLGVFEIRYINKHIIIRFYEIEEMLHHHQLFKQNPIMIQNKENHNMYVIVRSLKNQNQESTGYKLRQGSFLRIGQKEYFVASVHGQRSKKEVEVQDKIMMIDSILNTAKRIVVDEGHKQGECKYCMMEETEEPGQFLCSPCKCSGSCAQVHFNCLERWNQSKVKKNKVQGLTYYNFQKFFCEVCKEEYPKYIQRGSKTFELMPIQLPKGQHIILEEVEMKNSSLVCIEDIPSEGIRMGRGNECEIKVDSPSISRNHARIMKKYGDYYVFDNKSKFGTLVKDQKIYLEIDFTKKGIQIDRSVLMFSLCKNVMK